MFKLLCNCAAVALVLAAFAGVDAKATDGVVEQIFAANTGAGTPQVPDVAGAEPEADNPEKDTPEANTTETSKSELPDVEELVRKAILKAFAPTDQQQVEIDKKVMVDLIDFTGMPQSKLPNTFAQIGLKTVPETKYEYSDDVPAGCVISQEPAARTSVTSDSVITVVVAQKEIAIEPFKYQLDIADPETWAQKIVHRPFDVQLGPAGDHRIRQVSMFSIAYDGEHGNLADTDYGLLEARAVSIANNLLMAWNLMDDGAELTVVPDQSDEVETWHVRGPFGPEYPVSADSDEPDKVSMKECVHINVVQRSTSLRVMTVYPEDASLYGSPHYSGNQGSPSDRGRLSPEEAAKYIASLMEVHHLLFSKKDVSFEAFDELDIDNARISELFQDIRDKAERLVSTGKPMDELLRRALASFAKKADADLLYSFARVVPDDWRIREEYGK
jgi:hypothetical protein